MGIDPGSLHTGYGLLDITGRGLVHVSSGRLSPKCPAFPERLRFIFEGLMEIVSAHGPACVALESVFTYKNPRSAIMLAQARGVAVLAASLSGLPVFEYAPQQVKNSVCGNGLAEKSQVAFMAGKILSLPGKLPPDATDALAVAICHAAQATVGSLVAARPLPGKSRSKSFRSLSPEDLEAMGFKFEK
jgi:crossover junction endodeoxyribonuclease RuvC